MKKESKFIKSFRYLCLSFVVVVGLVAIIGTGGGGGGGGGGDDGGSTPLATGTFIKTAQLDSNTDWYRHFNTFTTDRRVQHLYLADEIDGSGYITAIAFRSNTTTVAEITCPDLTLKMGHTSLSALTDTFAFNVEQGKGSLETVLTNAQVVIPVVSAEDYFEIQLDTPFYYNGVDNLVVDFIRTGVCDATIILDGDSAFLNGALFSDDLASATGNLAVGLNMKFTFEGGTNTVISADKTSDNDISIAPGDTGRTQMLLMAEHIDGSGPITGLSIFPNATTTATEISSISVSMIHVAATSLTATFADNYGGSTPVTVAQDVSYNIPAGQSAAVWIPFNVANFTYDGTSNLLIDISATVSSGGYSMDYKNVPDVRVVSAGTADAIVGFMRFRAFEPVLRFNGGTMDRFTLGNFSTAFPFSTVYSGRQYLYTAGELGTQATITKVALRLNSTSSTADDYLNFTITMGHTSLTELTDVFGDNMDDATQVYNGTFSMPAGLIEGDWIEMTLDSPFIYNGTGNLVVSFESDGGTTGHTVILGSSATEYPNRVLNLNGNVLQNLLADIRFWIQ